MKYNLFLRVLVTLLLTGSTADARQTPDNRYWHGKERSIRYHPEKTDFVITNGNRRFTRALYGTNTAFRVEAGDLPEFALTTGDSTKWLINCAHIVARYRPGTYTALANWQAVRNEVAFNLWKSKLLSTMYLGGSPGNIGQISFYDAACGEAYRAFADPVAMTARSLVESLFDIHPNALICRAA